MMPVYMDSSQPRHMRPQAHHMRMDAASPSSCECWPTPPPCYGSCVHGNFPAYNAYWPPCYPPQVQYHPCCGNHSGFHPHAPPPPYYGYQPFPVGYQPWCDSERKHGCGTCTPQRSYVKNDGGVVIEEHEPELEKGNQREAVHPVPSGNCSFPVIWVPYENAKNPEYGGYPGLGSHGQVPAEVKAPENMKIQKSDPRVRSGYFPFDENTLKSLMQNQDKMQNGRTMELPFDISKLKSLLQGQDGMEVQTQKKKEEQNQERQKMQNGKTVELPFDISKLKSLLQGLDGKDVQVPKNKEEVGQSPYPIFWIPSHGKQEDVEASESKERSDEDHNLKPAPSGHSNVGQVCQYKGKEESEEEKSSIRSIPVEKHIQAPRNIPVKLSDNHLPKPTELKTRPVEHTNESLKKEQPSSPPKASRLPPVCLRVDPLPKRKNGGSKSLSPPRRKEQPLKAEETKAASPPSSKKAETLTVPEACNVKCEDAKKGKKISEVCLNATGTEKESLERNLNQQEGANCEIVKPCETTENRENPVKKMFTEEEAARIIQPRYRGYAVRRGEPIKKLKEIDAVREQTADVKRRIKELEVSTDQDIQEKEIVILGEMVMSLLLKLDAVQGLHPSIRDHRKSLARELADIQDKVDSMKKSNAEKKAVDDQVENTSRASDCPGKLEDNQLSEENKMVSVSNTEKVLLPSLEEHPSSVMNTADEELAAEAEKGMGLSETLATYPEPATETGVCEALATSTVAPEKIAQVETVSPSNTSSTDGMTTTNIEEDRVMLQKLEEPLHELPPVVEPTPGMGCEGPEDATKVFGTDAADASANDRKGDENVELHVEKDVELSEILPVGVIGDETQLLSQDLSPITCDTAANELVASSTIIPEKTEDVETVLPINPPSADGNAEAAIIIEEDKAEVEKVDEPLHELPQVVEFGCESPESTNEVSEPEVKASENDDRQGDKDTELPSEKAVELSELPVGVINEEKQILSQGSEAQTSAMDVETAIQEETNVNHLSDQSRGQGQETSELQEETDVIEKVIPEETEKLMEENRSFKETMETCEPQEETEQPPETEDSKHEISEDTKKLIEENQRFKETMETLVKAGREQLEIISQLTGRVKSLEKQLSQKKKRAPIRKPYRGKYTTKSMSVNASASEAVL